MSDGNRLRALLHGVRQFEACVTQALIREECHLRVVNFHAERLGDLADSLVPETRAGRKALAQELIAMAHELDGESVRQDEFWDSAMKEWGGNDDDRTQEFRGAARGPVTRVTSVNKRPR